MSAWCPRRPEEGTRAPETGITGGYESPCEYWESNLGPQKDQQTLLTAKSSFQSSKCCLLKQDNGESRRDKILPCQKEFLCLGSFMT